MQDFLHYIFLDNSVKNYLIVLGIILFTILFKRFLSKIIANWLYKSVSKPPADLKRKSFLNKVLKPLDVFLVLFISLAAINELNFPKILDFTFHKVSLKSFITGIESASLIIVFIWLCRRVIDFIALILEEKANATSDQTDNQLIVFFKDFFKVIFIIIGGLLILRFTFHKDIGNLLTGLSIVGAAIALSLRESLENLIASFIIFFNKPFVTGDVVKIDNYTGVVEKVGLRSTRIRSDAKTYITVPNKQMVDRILDNITLRTQRKIEIRLEISIDTTTEQLKALTPIFKEMIKGFNFIESNHIYFMETGKNAHIFALDIFTSISQTIQEFYSLREEINIAVLEVLKNQNIDLAAKSSTITLQKT
ncbi:MAG: mechanosensitive ion channel family protein [Chitinophagales bacterium]|nr:mechanosensitive ion channel family protein [Chitinophagales bacterium]